MGQVDPGSSAGYGGDLYEYQPNSVVQGLDILDRVQQGSVSTGTRRLAWAEVDFTVPGVTPDSALVFGRRYFSGLTDDGRFSTGARWVSSVTERLVAQTTSDGDRALQHFSWLQPYNDPSLYYVETEPGSNVFVAPAFVGGTIVQDGSSYELTFKNGAKHTFASSPYGTRVVRRADPWGNEIDFVYTDPVVEVGYGYAVREIPEDPEDLLTGGTLVITDSRGVSYTLAINWLGYITSITDGLGHTYLLDYSTVGAVSYLTKVTYPARQVMEPNGSIVTRQTEREFTYDSNGRLSNVIDDYGVVVLHNTYDTTEPWKVASQTDGNGAVWTFTEPASGQTDVVNPRGFKRSYLHNSQFAVTEIRQYQANFLGNPARTANQALYYSWQFERNHGCNCGVVTKITEPDGGTIEIVRSSAMNMTEVRKEDSAQALELVWKWTYDTEHRIASFIPPEGNAATDPAPYTTMITRQLNGGVLTTTTTIPARDWRTTPSVWVDTSDDKGRMLERVGPAHDSGTTSFEGKWTYHTTGNGILMPKEAYTWDSSLVSYTYNWDLGGRLSSIVDANANTWSCTYDPEGRAKVWTAPSINGGQVYTHEWLYDGNGRLRRLRWKYFADDQATTTGTWIEWLYTYDAMGQVLTQSRQLDDATTPAYATSSWTYDLHGNVLTATDPDGYVTSATYDDRDLPWVMTDGVGTTEQTSKSYDYNDEGRLSVIVERLDATRQVRFENEYDGLDRLFRYHIKDEADHTVKAGYVETAYDSGSRIEGIWTYGTTSGGGSQLVDKKTFEHDDFHGSPTRQITQVYELSTGAPIRSIISDFEYAASGRALREYTETDLIAQYTYYANGLPKKIYDLHGNALEVTYDRYGYVQTEVNTYEDQVAQATVSTTRTFGRDIFGRATNVTDSGSGVANQAHQFVYDSCDNVVERTAPDGAVQTYQFRFDGALLREDSVIAGSTMRAQQSLRTPAGRVSKIIDDRNQSVDMIYDGRGRMKQEVYPDGSTWTNAFNDAGLLTKITAPTGRTVDLTYDWRGMIAGAVYTSGSGTLLRTDVFEIDLGGNVKKVTKTEGGVTQSVEMLHDSTGRVLTDTTVIPGLPTSTVQFAYDGRGRLQSITTPYGYNHVYSYDDRNRVDSISLQHAQEGTFSVASYDYLGSGASVRRRITGDGSQLDVLRDGHLRATTMSTPSVAEFKYGYDAGNRVNSEFRQLEGVGNVYWYDGLGRLTNTTRDTDDPLTELATPGSTTHTYQREFVMDGDAHRSAVDTTPMGGSASTTTYTTHSQRHHYTAIQEQGQAAVSRSFDLDGRLVTQGNRTFKYDAADNLTEVVDGTTTVGKYVFDAVGRRVMKTAGAYDIRYIYAGPWVVETHRRIVGGSTWYQKGEYVNGPGVDNIVMMRHWDWVDQDKDINKVEPKNLFFHQNKLGSVMELTSEDGGVVESYRYDEYGKVSVFDENGAPVPAAVSGNSFLFTGREYDWETGLYHYRSRAYDPSTGSFLQEDSAGMADGVNVIAYVQANPVNVSDPFGTDGIGDMIDGIMSFIDNNRDLIADLVVDLLGPLEGILDLLSAATGKDITGWLRGGMKGEPESMGWWGRACAAASAACKIAAGGVRLFSKLKNIFDKIAEVVQRAKDYIAKFGKKAFCKVKGAILGGKHCFIAGTLVLVASGELVAIEAVELGDIVVCEEPSSVPGVGGVESLHRTAGRKRSAYEGALITIVVDRDGSNQRVTGTPEHPFWCVSRHRWVPMGRLAVGDLLDGIAGDVVVIGREVEFGRVAVFNLEVERAHSYRVSELGVLVHNGCNLELDATGKVHGDIPGYVPPSMAREEMEDMADDLRSSIKFRKEEARRLGEDGPHRARINDEERFLRQLEKKMNG